MCGITGILNINGRPVEPECISAMTSTLRHRGPDGEGVWVEGCVAFGHTRLAILDLSDHASQPMISADGRYVLVFNGEIYNYRELRNLLQACGYVFKSTGDTEVLLAALMEWGEDVVPRLNGMFAFALWDNRTRQLLLGRDRYGIKPLYIARRNGVFAFASEIKALTAHPALAVEVDKEGLLEYFTFQNFFSERTLFKDVHTFPAGYTMRLRVETSEPSWNRYWNFCFKEPESPVDPRECSEELDRLFKQAVKRQMMGDVEIGSYLSSGIDSGAITAIAASKSSGFKTFTCGFDLNSSAGAELYFDERVQAEAISSLLGTEHYQVVLNAGDMQRSLPNIAYHLDEPRVGQSYPNYYAAKLASRFVKVVLSGTGGDELFAGYPWRYYRAVTNNSFEEYVDKYYKFWQRLIPNRLIQRVFSPIWKDVSHVWTRDIFRDVFNGHPNELRSPEDYVNHSLYFEAKTFLHGLLMVEDKLSMAHGLESRVPFLDNDLVDFSMRIPAGLKLRNLSEVVRLNENEPGPKVRKYFEKTRDGKLILRQVMRQYVGSDTAGAVKLGFSGPDGSWFKNDSLEFIQKKLLDKSANIYEFLDYTEIKKLILEHLSGQKNRRLLIWSLLNFNEWYGKFL